MEILTILKSKLVYIELLAGLIGIWHWNKVKAKYWQYFALYLVLLAFSEMIVKWLPKEARNTFYSYTIPCQFLFFFWLFYEHLLLKRKQIIVGVIVYLISLLIEHTWLKWQDQRYVFDSISYSIGNIILLVFILYALYDLVFSDRILNYHKEQIFWVSIGLMLFYLGTFPYFSMYNYLKVNYLELLKSYGWLVTILNYLMYTLFALSFVWGSKK